MDESRRANEPSPTIKPFLPAALILMFFGWGSFLLIIFYTIPSGGTRWAFFFSLFSALTGTALPIVAFLNRRFPSQPPATGGVILRQAIWAGLYLPTLAWLRIYRALNLPIALLLALGLIVIEWLLRLRERSQWKPQA